MAAELATLADLKDYLGLEGADDDVVLTELLDDVESMLEEATDEVFTGAGTVTDEPHNGDGSKRIKLARPATSVTSVEIGQEVATPDETLTADVIVDPANPRNIQRVDGGVFPRGVRNIHVTYEAAVHLPNVARMAVLEATAFIYRRRGREHVSGETVGEFGSVSMSARLDFLPAWQAATRRYRGFVYA